MPGSGLYLRRSPVAFRNLLTTMNRNPTLLRSLLAALTCVALTACATAPATPTAQGPTRPDPRVVARLTETAAKQVKRCYRSPRIAKSARQITTRLRVHYAPDGQLATLPVLVGQAGVTDANKAHAAAMAEAAMLAVVRCSPLALPREFYQAGWDEFELTFSPRTFA